MCYQTLYQYWIHTELIGKLPPFIEYVMNTPSHHRVHHGRNPYCIDKNYGALKAMRCDWLAGTWLTGRPGGLEHLIRAGDCQPVF